MCFISSKHANMHVNKQLRIDPQTKVYYITTLLKNVKLQICLKTCHRSFSKNDFKV